MIRQSTPAFESQAAHPTVWGLTPAKLHDRYWAARGVQVVRPGESSEIVRGAELFLLTDPRQLVTFKLRTLIDHLSWIKPDLLWLRLRDKREHGYREQAIADTNGRFERFERLYGCEDAYQARVALTPDPDIARMWQAAPDARTGWCQLRRCIPRSKRSVITMGGRVYVREADREMMQLVRDMIEIWKSPDTTVDRAVKVRPGVWADTNAQVDKGVDFVGPAWIGAGRRLSEGTDVTGPAVLWDDPKDRPEVDEVRWENLEPKPVLAATPKPQALSRFDRGAKRAFDVVFATIGLMLVLPVFPMVMLAIWIEDGRPFFFGHRRETLGGHVFPCLKFRSMRKDADKIKAEISQQNQVDGPQFFIADDPRITRVGRFIRKNHIDELPQLFNVLAGHMSIVGPRPSPYEENQFCPPWREARLSVRPGITGLWQVCRTREEGMDFQEWIKFDLEYVENASFTLDIWIIWKTLAMLVFGK